MAAKKKATAKKPAAKKQASAKRSAAPKRTTKQVAAKKAATTKSAAKKKAPAKKAAATKTSAKKAPAKKAPAKKAAATKTSATKAPAKKASSSKATPKQATTKQPTPKKPAAAKSAATKKATAAKRSTNDVSSNDDTTIELPKPRFNKDGFGYTKDFDLSFVKEMYELLQEERVSLTGQAKRLEDEAHQLVEEAEMGDVQFDDEGGEGDTMVVERERDLALSAQAREAVLEIDAALDRIKKGTYGYSVVSGKPIPRERLEAIPWSSELVEEKVGGIGRR